MSNFKVIIPQATTNECDVPSFETTYTSWTAGGANTRAQVTTYAKFGYRSLEITYQDSSNLALRTSVTLTGTAKTYMLSGWVYVPSNWDGTAIYWSVANFTLGSATTVKAWTSGTDDTDTWVWLVSSLSLSSDYTGDIRLTGTGSPTAGRKVYLDGVQWEEGTDATTYCDGTQPGCYWMGTPHGSISKRRALETRGGKILDFTDDLSLIVGNYAGMGMPAVANHSSPNALLPGAAHTGQKLQRRSIQLGAHIEGSSLADLHDTRQAILKAFYNGNVPASSRSLPRLFEYDGATADKRFSAVYDSGLEAFTEEAGFNEPQVRVKLLADDPMFYQIGERGAALDTRDSTTFFAVAGRIDGIWDTLGVSALSGNDTITRIVAGPDGLVYFGGDFTNMDGVAAADYIATFDPVDETWAGVGTFATGASTPIIRAMAFDADGNLYAGGDFTNAAGVAAADKIAMWNGSSWTALGNGLNGDVNDILVHTDGNVYVAGEFTSETSGTAMAKVGYWDGSSWNAMGAGAGGLTGGTPFGDCLASALNGNVYVGGTFTAAGGVSAVNIAEWNGSTFTALEGGLNNNPDTLQVAADGQLYVGGDFTTADSKTVNYVARWNGYAWYPLGDGLNERCWRLKILDNGNIWAVGEFTVGGTATTGVAFWNGSTWARPGITLPSSWAPVKGLEVLNDNIYLGWDVTGTAYYAGTTDISYAGTAPAKPWITVNRSGGTLATVRKFHNLLTGAELFLNYNLLDGETLTIDLRPGRTSVTSSLFGNRWDKLLPNSDIAQFAIMPGNDSGEQTNTIAAYVYTEGSPTVTTILYYRDTYLSAD